MNALWVLFSAVGLGSCVFGIVNEPAAFGFYIFGGTNLACLIVSSILVAGEKFHEKNTIKT